MGEARNKNVLTALFDVKPVNQRGDVDLAKLNQIKSVLDLRQAVLESRQRQVKFVDFSEPVKKPITQPGQIQPKPKNIQPAYKHPVQHPMLNRLRVAEKQAAKPFQEMEIHEVQEIDLPKKLPTREELLEELHKIDEYEDLLKHENILLARQFIQPVAMLKAKPKQRPKIVRQAHKPSAPMQAPEPIMLSEPQMPPVRLAAPRPVKKIRPIKKKITRSDVERVTDNKKVDPETLYALEQFYFPEVKQVQANAGILERPLIETGPAETLPKPEASLSHIDKKNRKIFSKPVFKFMLAGFLITVLIPLASWVSEGLAVKDGVLSSSASAYQSLLAARQALETADWQTAADSFSSAQRDFSQAHQEVKSIGSIALGILQKLPGGSVVESGYHLVKVGENVALAGQTLAEAIKLFSLENMFTVIDSSQAGGGVTASKRAPLTQQIAQSQDNLIKALANIRLASSEISQVDPQDLPNEVRQGVADLQEKLPLVEDLMTQAVGFSGAFLKILGHDNPRQYLLVFQNNSEIRATGGFIGTYGLLALDQGSIKKLFIDGVFNADGQLHEKVIPPMPIQKISTAWSMHDANWFADWPTSAQRIEWFYEKTGGPTVDGVLSLTPTVIENLLALTGPISMPDYGVELDAHNFVELIQYKVEVDYDKRLNQPKKILADFAPMFITALGNLSDDSKKKAVEIIYDALEQKHILAYFNDSSLQSMAVAEGWAGQIKDTAKDYLSVVSSNINGFKTDKMVKETIEHQATIQSDGSVIDTLTITREHTGGREKYDWLNKVNSNYLRVYLPKGSELISVRGQTIEAYQPPIDYAKNGFKTDPIVIMVEQSMVRDSKTGTYISEESGKTVFGNWVYVSPGRKVVLTYEYKLPFKINLAKPSDTYSLLVQKQLGSIGSSFSHELAYPQTWDISYQYPDNLNAIDGKVNYSSDLSVDRFIGVTLNLND